MSEVLVGSGYGRTVAFRGDELALEAVTAELPFWWTKADTVPDHVVDVVAPGAVGSAVRDLERWVAEHARGFVFVHAAVVAVDGRALLLPGRSFAGKTTLCVELLTRGATYLSDEYAVLDPDGRVHPYPRPIQVRDDGLQRVLANASAYGAVTADRPHEVGVVALVTYDEAAWWEVEELSPGEAVLALLDHALCARTRPTEALDAVSAVVEGARCVRGRRGDAVAAGVDVLRLLRRM